MSLQMSRRSVLRGIGATLALPFLEAMTPLTALAGGTAEAAARSACRLLFIATEGGIWTGEDGFFPYKTGPDPERAKVWGKNGILPGGFVADTGTDFKLTHTLEPLAELRNDILLMSGLHHRNDEIPNTIVNDHGQDLGTLLTAANISGTPGVALKNSMSVDQYIAARIGDRTRFSSLQLQVGSSSYNTREATGAGYMGFLSYDADGNALPTEGDPGALYDRLFTDGSKKQKIDREVSRRRQKSILDGVMGDLKKLDGDVAAQDRRKLDEYFTTLREVERRVEQSRRWDDIPIHLPPGAARPAHRPGDVGDGSSRIEEIRLMLDVLALALQTDVTRIATLRLGGYYGTFKFLGFPEDPHGVYAHNNGDPQKVAGAKAIDRFYVSQLAYLMGKLRDIEEPGGSVLDNSMIYYGGGLTNGPNLRLQGGKVTYNAHGHHNHPVLLAGRAGGALKTGRHLTFDEGTPQTNLFVNMMELMGMPGERFGDSKEPLSGLV